MEKLPDAVLMQIFSLLDARSKLTIVSVCRRFYMLAGDQCVWKCVDFTDFKRLTLRGLSQFLKSRPFSLDRIDCVRLEGSFRRRPSPFSKQRDAVSAQGLQLIKNLCPRLNCLDVIFGDISHATASDFPQTLHILNLEGSKISSNFFLPCSDTSIFPNLEHLNLNQVHISFNENETGAEAFLILCQKLKTLKIRNNFNCSLPFLHSLPLRLPNLRVLDVSYLDELCDGFFSILSRHCPHIVDLNASFCHSVTNGGVSGLISDSAHSSIRRLHLAECFRVTDDCLPLLAQCQQLVSLNLIKTGCTEEGVVNFRFANPRCRVYCKWSDANIEEAGSSGSKVLGDGLWLADGN